LLQKTLVLMFYPFLSRREVLGHNFWVIPLINSKFTIKFRRKSLHLDYFLKLLLFINNLNQMVTSKSLRFIELFLVQKPNLKHKIEIWDYIVGLYILLLKTIDYKFSKYVQNELLFSCHEDYRKLNIENRISSPRKLYDLKKIYAHILFIHFVHIFSGFFFLWSKILEIFYFHVILIIFI